MNAHEPANISEVKEVRDGAKAIVKSEYGCPLRTDITELLTCLPVEKLEPNRALLADWILVYYMSLVLTICPHHPTSEMIVPSPHTLYYGKGKVKSLIDNYCSLGVKDPVPAGTSTTWCSRLLP